jgi:hypothetical protein
MKLVSLKPIYDQTNKAQNMKLINSPNATSPAKISNARDKRPFYITEKRTKIEIQIQ